MPTIAQWQETWMQLGAAAADERLFQDVIARYAEPQRKYHTLQHLRECLDKFQEVRTLAAHPAEVELALWFHDAIYETARSDNEQRSADWARAAALARKVLPGVAQRVHALIMATRHKAVPQGADAALVVDVDLSILGAAPGRFDEYERQIREEYASVPAPLYIAARRKILGEFLARPRIFSTGYFFEGCERQARANITRSLARLAGS